jgi:hypothetical protein
MDYKQGTCIEIAKGDGTYIGLFEEVKDGILVMKDVMKINLTPVPSEGGQGFMMVPKLDLLNYYSVGNDFSFPVADINYHAEVTGSQFVAGYKQQYKGYEQMKIQQGSNIEVVPANVDINDLKTT